MLLVNINDYSIVCGGSYFHVNTPAISHLIIADHMFQMNRKNHLFA